MTVQLAPPIIFQSFLSTGTPNAFGTVATYIAGTTTPQATYVDSTQTTQNQNPTPLNALGQASIWLATNLVYKIVVFDSLGNQINFQDQIIGGQTLTGLQLNVYGTDSGIVNAYVYTHSGPVFAAATLAIGTLVRFTPLNTNTGPSTLNADGTGAVGIIRANGAALTGGELSSLGPVVLQSTGAKWQIVSTAGAQPGFERTAAETAAAVVPINYVFAPGVVDRYGTNTIPGTTDMTTAITNAVAANFVTTFLAAKYNYASTSPLLLFGKRITGAGTLATLLKLPNVTNAQAVQNGGTDTAAPGMTAMIISGGDPVLGGTNSTAYAGVLYGQTGVGCRRSKNSDVIVTQFTRTDAITFTGAPAMNATSATLTANWTLPSNSYEVMFSDGECRIVYLTNGATTATWPLGLTGGAVTVNAQVLTAPGIELSAQIGAGVYYNGFDTVSCGGPAFSTITFTGAPVGGATSATLTANFTLPTGVYAVAFSDNEVRPVTLTNGATTATWAIGLVNGVTTTATVTAGNAAGWRSHTSDGPTNGNRINANSWVNSGGVFNVGSQFMFDYAAADTLHASDREVSSGAGIHVGTNVFGLTILGGDDENNQSGSVLKESSTSDIHLLGGNVVPAPGTLNWTVSDQWLPGGSQANNFGIAPNSAATNFVIGGGTINMTATNPAWRLTGSTTLLFNNAAKSLAVQGPASQNAASPPAQVTGWGSPTGAAVVNNYNITDAGGANSNTNKAVAEIIAYLKSRGDFGA